MATKIDTRDYSTYNGENSTTSWDASLSTRHISNGIRNFEGARSGFFVFEITPDQFEGTGALHSPYKNREVDSEDVYDSATAAEAIKLNVVKSSIPNFTIEAKEYRRGNDVIKFASVPTFNSGSLTVDDVVGPDTKALLYSWLYLAYDPRTRKGGRMEEYKKTCTLTECTQGMIPIRSWTLEGVFILGIEEGDFDKENDDKRQLTVSISFDRAIMNLPDQVNN